MCVDQFLYNSNLIKLSSACAKQNAAVKTASDYDCTVLSIYTLPDLVSQWGRSFIISLEQIMKSFLEI